MARAEVKEPMGRLTGREHPGGERRISISGPPNGFFGLRPRPGKGPPKVGRFGGWIKRTSAAGVASTARLSLSWYSTFIRSSRIVPLVSFRMTTRTGSTPCSYGFILPKAVAAKDSRS